MYKIFSISVTFILLFVQLFGSLSESEYGVPTTDYTISALQYVYSPIYKSGVYEDHRWQTHRFISELSITEPLSVEEEGILAILMKDLAADVIKDGFQHRRLMQEIRYASSQNLEKSPFLDEYIYWLFTQPQLSAKTATFLEDKYGLNLTVIEQLYLDNPSQLMTNCYMFLQEQGLPTKILGPVDEYANDPLLYGDMPFFLYEWRNSKKTKVIRIPNMARDYMEFVDGEIQFESKINEEFYHYLKVLTKKKQKQLYINLMARHAESRDEAKTSLIEKLELDPEIADSIIVVTLDRSKSSDFYMQTGIYKGQNDSAHFKRDFYERMIDPEGEYYWSKKIAGNSWNLRLKEILDIVHTQFFDDAPSMTFEERVDFIELTYLHIANKLMSFFEPDFLNISCKNTIDRGPSLYTLTHADQLLESGKKFEDIYEELVSSLLHPPAAFHNRNGHLFRIMRFDSALDRLIRHSRRHAPVMP